MSDLRKAAKDLLHEYDSGIFDDDHDLIHAVNALRAALDEPRPEPVAWMESPHGVIRANPDYRFNFPSQLLHWQIPLYMADDAEALRRDAERYRRLLKWLIVTGLLSRERCRIDSPASYRDWWILQKPKVIDGSSLIGYGETEDAAIDAAMEDKT